jgi:hypothetical protein
MELIISRILIFVTCFCVLNIVREVYTFYQCYAKMETYKINNKRMFGLWASISYILTIILTGI